MITCIKEFIIEKCWKFVKNYFPHAQLIHFVLLAYLSTIIWISSMSLHFNLAILWLCLTALKTVLWLWASQLLYIVISYQVDLQRSLQYNMTTLQQSACLSPSFHNKPFYTHICFIFAGIYIFFFLGGEFNIIFIHHFDIMFFKANNWVFLANNYG